MFSLLCYMYNASKNMTLNTKFSYKLLKEVAEHLNLCVNFDIISIKQKKRKTNPTDTDNTWYEIKDKDKLILTINEDGKVNIVEKGSMDKIIPYLDSQVVERYFPEYHDK